MAYEEVAELVESVPGGYPAVFISIFVGLLGVILVCVSYRRGSERERGGNDECEGSDGERDVANEQPKAKGSKPKQGYAAKKAFLPSHPLLAAEFKGHTGSVLSLDFDINGKYLGSCSDDRTIRLWYMKTLQDREHRYARRNIDLDHATRIKFSPDGTAVVATMAVSNTVNVYRITKAQKGGVAKLVDAPVDFPKLPSQIILSLGIASTGKFIMTYSADSFSIWSLKGEELATTATLQSPNTSAAVSPCGKFVACAGFTSDVKLWEVEFSKSGEFHKVSKAMDLKGHHASVLDISFSGDSHRMASVSRDGSWKFWKIDVEYKLREDPWLLVTGDVSVRGESLISVAPDSRVVAVAVNLSIFIYSTSSGDLLLALDSVHKGIISALVWDPSSRYLVSAGGEDKHIRVWHNTPGMKQLLIELEAKLPKASSEPLKRRIVEQIKETRDCLDSIGPENS